jgi:DNA-binding NtrC family response regulator
VTAFGDPVAAVAAIERLPFDLILTDLKMPKMDGLAVIRAIRAAKCESPVIVMTAYGTVATAVEAMKLGAFDFVQKPFEADGLTLQIDRALQHHRLRRENEAFRVTLADQRRERVMIGDSEAMQLVQAKIEQYTASDATVLISGASGTGKELAAAAIHSGSGRQDHPLLCLNCASLSANLLESELFGHERGAFTGADRMRKGRFELAHGGTLLLDEVSEMALPLQSKLLRVLQEGEFERVGSSVTQRGDVRIIATTNRDLADWIARKRFRSDLFYRLNVLPLHLPALCDRREDVSALVECFLKRMARQAGRETPRIEPGAMELLRKYNWPGNVRELENICQRAVATVPSSVIRACDIEHWVQNDVTQAEVFHGLRSGRMLEDVERQLIEQTLKRFGGHRAKTAKELGMGLRTLGLKLKQWREQTEADCGLERQMQTA